MCHRPLRSETTATRRAKKKFSENGFYIERYVKCGTCGVLIYEKEGQSILVYDGDTYCSQWCIDWKTAREKRRVKVETAGDQV